METRGEQTMVRIRAVVGVLLVGELYSSRLALYEEQLPYKTQQIGEAITLEEYDMIWSHRLRMKYTPQVVEYVQKLFGRFNSPEFQQRFQEMCIRDRSCRATAMRLATLLWTTCTSSRMPLQSPPRSR